MKCIKLGDEIKRVKDDKAETMVDKGWSYCSKEEWKKKGRTVAKEDVPEVLEKKVKKEKKKRIPRNGEEQEVKKD